MMKLKLPKVALALLVKNEFSDITGWIAWHAALGVEAFFIFDDHSTDGTWDILQACAKIYPITLFRTDPEHFPTLHDRQKQAYYQAAEEARGLFDWIGFLDSDEYLYLRRFETLPEYFATLGHAQAVGFSWRIYGSNHRALRPKIPTVEAFTRHAPENFDDNAHIKSFIRPECLGENYTTPHCFDLLWGEYVHANGKRMANPYPRQKTDWQEAYILHFICRSMAHYSARIQRRLREDLSDTTSYWDYFNRNDCENFEPLRLLPRLRTKLAPLQQEKLRFALSKLRDLPLVPDKTLYPPQAKTAQPEICTLKSCWGTELYYCPQQQITLHATAEKAREKNFLPIYGVFYPKTPTLLCLSVFPPNSASEKPSLSFLNIPKDQRLLPEMPYLFHGDSTPHLSLMNPASFSYLSCLPPEEGIGQIEADRMRPQRWEKLTPKKLSDSGSLFFKKDSASMPDFSAEGKVSALRVLNWIKNDPELPESEHFLRVLYNLSPEVLAEILAYIPGLLWDIV